MTAAISRLDKIRKRLSASVDYSNWTISQLWQEHESTMLEEVAAGTRNRNSLTQTRTAMSRWRQFWAELSGIENAVEFDWRAPAYKAGASGPQREPAVISIESEMLETWLDWCQEEFEISNSTVNNYATAIKSLVRDGTRKKHRLPIVSKRAEGAGQAAYLSPEEILSLYQACERARWPMIENPASWWRAAVVMFVHYGFRLQELISYTRHRDPINWGGIHWGPRFPKSRTVAQNQFGWIEYTPRKQIGSKPDPLILPMTLSVASHLRAIAPANPLPVDPVFQSTQARKQLAEQFTALTAAAGLTMDRRINFKDLRSVCASWHELQQTGIAGQVLGHAKRSVTERHYLQLAPLLISHFSEFQRRLPDPMKIASDDRQSMLF